MIRPNKIMRRRILTDNSDTVPQIRSPRYRHRHRLARSCRNYRTLKKTTCHTFFVRKKLLSPEDSLMQLDPFSDRKIPGPSSLFLFPCATIDEFRRGQKSAEKRSRRVALCLISRAIDV